MREMKDSGMAWMGNIPKDWRVERLQWHLDEIKESNSPIKTTQILSLTNKTGVIPYEEKGEQGNKSKEKYDEYKLAFPDTIVANSMNILIGSVGICHYYGCVSPVYVVFECKDGYANYFDLYRTTERFKTEVLLRAIGGVRQSLNYTDFAMIQTIIAPQETIDAFNPMFEKIKVTQKHLETENNRLAELRDTLLPKLMSGELKVNEIA